MLSVDVGDVTKTLLNAGSVGNPLDLPLATYVIMTGVLDGDAPAPFSLDFVRLTYDIEAEAALSRQIGQPDAEAFIVELKTAVYRRIQKKAT